MSDSQYNQYKNLHVFASEWRKYKKVSKLQTKDAFRKDMQFNGYVKIECVHPTGKPVHIYLLAVNSRYANSAPDIKRLLAKIREPTDIILVSALPFKANTRRALTPFKHLRIKTYLHENFNLIIPDAALCYPHEILSHDEVNNLLNNELYTNLVNLPKILIEDVQCIWIGAELGDVIRIKMASDITGTCYQYRVVVAKSGRVISFRDEESKDNSNDLSDNEIEDQIEEQREEAENDIINDSDED